MTKRFNQNQAAIISILLCIPFAFLFIIAFYKVQPFEEFFRENQAFSNLLIISSFLLLPVALVLNLMQTTKKSILNLILASIISLVIIFVIGAALLDQYDCFRGISNCD